MKRLNVLVGLVGLTMFGSGMVVALTSADDGTRLIASVVMVLGMVTLVLASFSWASAPWTAGPRSHQQRNRHPLRAAMRLHHAPGDITVRQPARARSLFR